MSVVKAAWYLHKKLAIIVLWLWMGHSLVSTKLQPNPYDFGEVAHL
jgi:hypothetical protein